MPGEDVAHIDPMLTGVDGYNRESLSLMRKNFGADFVIVGSYFDTGGEAGGQIRLDLRIQDTVEYICDADSRRKPLIFVSL